MSEITKLKKKLEKSNETVDRARAGVQNAVRDLESAIGERSVLLERLEQAETLETARELRSKG